VQARLSGGDSFRPHELPLDMEACRPVSRRSLFEGSVVEPEQELHRSSSTKSRRHSWSFRSRSSRSRDASPNRSHERTSFLSPSPSVVNKSWSPAPRKAVSAPHSPELRPEPLPARPRSSHGFSLRIPNFSRNLPPRGSTLPTIMEQKGVQSAETLRSRVSGTKPCRLWDGQTRTTVPWDGLRRVSIQHFWSARSALLTLLILGHHPLV
jgi:hypothetical protein